MTADLRLGSLCSGYGGLDLAVMDVLGGSMAWHCQYDPEDRHQYAARILEHHWPDVPNHGDITAVDWTQVEPVDVLTAGFPCQDLSYAGRGAGIKEGTRSGLWYAVEDAVRALRPGLIVLENVAAIVTRRPGLDVVLAGLAELGFDASWCCVRASDVGAAHQRNRWFCIAWPADAEGPGWEGANPQRGWPARDSERTAAYTANLRHERRGRARLRRPGPEDGGLSAADTKGDGWHERRPQPARQLRGSDAALSGRATPTDTDSPSSEACDGRQGAGHIGRPQFVVGSGADWGAYAPAIARWERVLRRLAPRPVDDRGRLAPVFVEWLMGLSAGHVTDVPGLTRNAQLKALGNGVVPQQAAYALRLLLDRMRSEVAA